MTEEEHLTLVEKLGLTGQDTMILEVSDNASDPFNIVFVEGQRIIHIWSNWGEVKVTTWLDIGNEEVVLMDRASLLNVGGELVYSPDKRPAL